MPRPPTKEEKIKSRCFLEMHLGASYSAEALAQLLADHAEETRRVDEDKVLAMVNKALDYRPPPATHTHDMVTHKGEHTPHCTFCGFRPEAKCIDHSLRREKCTKTGCPKCKPVRHG